MSETLTAVATPAAPASTPPVATVTAIPSTPANLAAAIPAIPPLSHSEYREMVEAKAQIDRLKAESVAAAEAARKAEFDALAAKGQTEQALKALEQREAETRARLQQEWERKNQETVAEAARIREAAEREKAEKDNLLRATLARAAKYAKDDHLSRALGKHKLVGESHGDLVKALSPTLSVQEEGDTFVVKGPDGQDVAAYVDSYLGKRPYLVAADNTTGGTHGSPTSAAVSPTPGTPPPPVQPKNMGEAVILHMQSMQKAQGDARANMGLAMGLKAVH